MTRFAVLGNCQAAHIGRCVRFLVPGCEVDAYVILETSEMANDVKRIADKLATYDYVLAQPQHYKDAFAEAAKAGSRRRIAFYPSVEFAAYHPDLVYIFDRASASDSPLKSPAGEYHSALAFLCYSIGLNTEQTISRFNKGVFDRLGYFAQSLWTASERSLLSSGRATGLPMEHNFRSWVRRGCFMYSANHPKLFVLADLAAGALSTCGLITDSRLCEEYVPDDSNRGSVWPVYPEIATRFGLDGSYIFKDACIDDSCNPYFSLRDFVEASFACYRSRTLGEMFCSRVEVWKADSALVDFVVGELIPVPVDDTPPSIDVMPPANGASRGLPCAPRGGMCIVDRINSVPATAVREISISCKGKTVFEGWAVDEQAGTVAVGVDIVIDGIPYRAAYGTSRIDVAQTRRNPAFECSGFQFSLAPSILGKGIHSFSVRILVQGGQAYSEGPSGRLIVE